MEQTIKDVEETDGIRLTWNIWPTTLSKLETIPIACLYNIHSSAVVFGHEPIPCKSCQSILCPQSIIDFGAYSWTCVFCNTINSLPPQARNLTPNSLLPELLDHHSNVEYVLNKETPFAPIFFLIIDQCTYDNERHELMKKSLKHTLSLIPDNSNIAVVLFGANIDLISFNDESLKTIYEFSGKIAYKKEDVSKLNFPDIRNFIVEKSKINDELIELIDNLEPDPFPVITGHRRIRCTGSAISFVISFLEGPFSDSPVKLMLFTQGPCTFGPGKVSTLEIVDSGSEKKPDLESAKLFYQDLSERLISSGHSIDIIAQIIADIGLEYFKSLITFTGGSVIMGQDFEERIIMKSIDKLFERREGDCLAQAFNVKIQVKTSSNISFKGFLGEGKALGSGWRIGSVLPSSNISLLFENNSLSKNGNYGYVQIISQYQQSDRSIITRATTFHRMFSDDKYNVVYSFDQEASCVFQARALVSKDYQNVLDFEAAIDKNLIKFMKRYASFEKGNPLSVSLSDSMHYYPNFMFFFRRSLLVQNDGISGDESAYFKILLYKLMAGQAIKMIKPALIKFHYQGDVTPVELDVKSLDHESILILDSFHNVLLWKGQYISDWIRDGLHESPENGFLKQTIEEAKQFSLSLLDRIPAPQYKETNAGKSQQRILFRYVNPSEKGVIHTERIDFAKFYETLCKFIVRNE